MTRFGYACLNMELREKGIFTSRTMRKKTFQEKGLEYTSELIVKNTLDLLKILKWNKENNIQVFRVSSEITPWASEYNYEDLPEFEVIKQNLKEAGNYAKENNLRLSFHPGQFNCLASEKERVVKNCIKDLDNHGKLFDLMGFERSHYNKINIHLGSTCNGNLQKAKYNFCKNFEKLSDAVKTRLTVENDDKAKMFSTKFLYENIFKEINVPIVFDSHHFTLGPQDSSYNEAFNMAYDSWPKGVKPVCHHSNGKKEYEDPTIRSKAAHSNFYYTKFDDCNKNVDVVLESKFKEKALFKYIKDFL